MSVRHPRASISSSANHQSSNAAAASSSSAKTKSRKSLHHLLEEFNDADIKAMQNGTQMTLFEAIRDANNSESIQRVNSRIIHLFYSANEAKLGTIHVAELTTDAQIDRHAVTISLPLHTVQDVYLSKQSLTLQHPSCTDYDSNTCFSIMSKDCELHLAAETTEQRSIWLNGIKQVFES
jgi:hypothetical protein